MKSDFEKWADSFYDDRFKPPNVIEHILFKIEDGSKYGAETGVWKCQESYFIPRESSIFYTTPGYIKITHEGEFDFEELCKGKLVKVNECG